METLENVLQIVCKINSKETSYFSKLGVQIVDIFIVTWLVTWSKSYMLISCSDADLNLTNFL